MVGHSVDMQGLPRLMHMSSVQKHLPNVETRFYCP